MRWSLVCALAVGCTPAPPPPSYAAPYAMTPALQPVAYDPAHAGVVIDRAFDFVFDGGRVEFEMRRDGDMVIELARNHYAVPIVMRWTFSDLDNLDPTGPIEDTVVLPAAERPNGDGPTVVLTTFRIHDMHRALHRQLEMSARFGDPAARPEPYAYRLPYRTGSTYSVLQGFHGAFSHRGSNEYAVDFDCPVATPVLAARPGVVVASNAAAQSGGTTPDFLEYRRTNFVLVLHDDGTLGEYMHLSPSGVKVSVGQRVGRGDELALSGNTGFSSTPHLHFQVMTAGVDGVSARSFPFLLAVAPQINQAPVQGHAYPSWE
ncbi:MAG TPA: M23 family metallopeptidase [Kofleriaceae bacterium]|nr:M23 family metallopeptidase [Kofleriaceae bacterium]